MNLALLSGSVNWNSIDRLDVAVGRYSVLCECSKSLAPKCKGCSFIYLFIYLFYCTSNSKVSANNKMTRKREEVLNFRCRRKNPNGETHAVR